jgi:pilus assembly protein CpaE
MAADGKSPRVLLLGERFAALAEQALPDAVFEVSGGDRLIEPASIHAGYDLVLLDADSAEPQRVADALEALSRRANAPAAMLLGSHLSASLVRALLKLERSDVLETPFTAGDLAHAAAALLDSAPNPSAAAAGVQPHPSHCWVVTGAVGGSGATTISIELATYLADRKKKGERVALIDLNLADGQACAYLGSSANMHLGDASASPDRIDPALLDAFAIKVEGTLDLFAAPRDPRAFEQVSPEAVCRLLEVACDVYDWVIVDLPRLRQPWTLDVLAGADEVLVVSELTVPALLSARALTLEIESEMDHGRPPRIVVNRLASRVFGPAPSLAEAEKALQRKVTAGITSDWEAAACSVNLGGAIGHHRPRSKIVKDVASLAEKLISHNARKDDHFNLRSAG